MQPKLTVEVKPGSGRDELVFSGPLSEETGTALSEVQLPSSLKKALVLDLYGIKHVNSVGIREWVAFLKQLEGKHEVSVKRCSPTFVMACNVVSSMLGHARVESVSRGYECVNKHYWWVDVPVANVDLADMAKVVCEQCGLKAAPEYDAEEYFRFLEA